MQEQHAAHIGGVCQIGWNQIAEKRVFFIEPSYLRRVRRSAGYRECMDRAVRIYGFHIMGYAVGQVFFVLFLTGQRISIAAGKGQTPNHAGKEKQRTELGQPGIKG